MTENGRGIALTTFADGWRALADVVTVEDAVLVVRGATVLSEAVRQARLGPHAQNEAGQLTIEAQARAGELIPLSVHPGNPQLFDDPTIGRLPEGVSRFQSHVWQRVAAVPAEVRAAYYRLVAENLATAEQEADEQKKLGPLEVTTAGVRRYWEMAVHRSSAEDEWLTPADIIARTLAVLGAIDLDPCSNTYGNPNVPAARRFSEADDGLSREWSGRVYMNPPYGAAIADWVGKLVTEHRAGRVTQAVALVPARTDTEWFTGLRDCAICLVRGRLRFSDAKASAPFPSVVAYFGPGLRGFSAAFAELGDIWWRYVTEA